MSKYLDPETETLRLFHYLIVELVGETYQIETRCAKKWPSFSQTNESNSLIYMYESKWVKTSQFETRWVSLSQNESIQG